MWVVGDSLHSPEIMQGNKLALDMGIESFMDSHGDRYSDNSDSDNHSCHKKFIGGKNDNI